MSAARGRFLCKLLGFADRTAEIAGMIRALILDFDGLILDTESSWVDAWVRVHGDAGLTCVREDALSWIGHVDFEYDPWTAFGSQADRRRLEREYRRIRDELLGKEQILPGVRECLDEARARGLKLGVASNSPHSWVDTHLRRLGLFDYFFATVCRDDVQQGKPEPEVYTAALAALSVEASEAIAFEDSHAGSVAAKRAGVRCIAVPNSCTRQHDFSHADLVLKSLAELRLSELLEHWAN